MCALRGLLGFGVLNMVPPQTYWIQSASSIYKST